METLQRRILLAFIALWPGPAALVTQATAHDADFTPPTGAITLRDALGAALRANPKLTAAAEGIRIGEARLLQAGLLPNPELKLEVEDLGGSGDRQAFETTQTTLRVSQLVELGGKRARRRALSGHERDAAAWDYEVQRVDVLAETARAFVTVLALQEQLALADEIIPLTAAAERAVDAQVHAGAGTPAETLRARIAAAQAEVERGQRARELAGARIALAASWGGTTPTFGRAAGDLAAIDPPPPLDALLARLDGNPDLVRWQSELAARSAALDLERARAIPDVTVGAGPRYFSDNGDVALVLELGVPLPVFDRNQGAVGEARARLAAAAAERRAATAALRANLGRDVEELRGAYEHVMALRRTVLPAAEAAVTSSKEAYRAGALRSFDVLDAQRTWFGLRVEYLRALAAYHLALIDVERLAGGPATTNMEAP